MMAVVNVVSSSKIQGHESQVHYKGINLLRATLMNNRCSLPPVYTRRDGYISSANRVKEFVIILSSDMEQRSLSFLIGAFGSSGLMDVRNRENGRLEKTKANQREQLYDC